MWTGPVLATFVIQLNLALDNEGSQDSYHTQRRLNGAGGWYVLNLPPRVSSLSLMFALLCLRSVTQRVFQCIGDSVR